MSARCLRCGAERSEKHLSRLYEVVAHRGIEQKPVYLPVELEGAPWVCTSRGSCKLRAKAARKAARTAAELITELEALVGCEHCGRRGPLDDEGLCREGCVR